MQLHWPTPSLDVPGTLQAFVLALPPAWLTLAHLGVVPTLLRTLFLALLPPYPAQLSFPLHSYCFLTCYIIYFLLMFITYYLSPLQGNNLHEDRIYFCSLMCPTHRTVPDTK